MKSEIGTFSKTTSEDKSDMLVRGNVVSYGKWFKNPWLFFIFLDQVWYLLNLY